MAGLVTHDDGTSNDTYGEACKLFSDLRQDDLGNIIGRRKGKV